MGEGPDLSLLADLAGLCKQEMKAKSECKLPTEAHMAQHTAPQQSLGDLLV